MVLLSLKNGHIAPVGDSEEEMARQFRQHDLFFELGTELAGLGGRDPLGGEEKSRVHVAVIKDLDFSKLDAVPKKVPWEEEIKGRDLRPGALFVVRTRKRDYYVVKVIAFTQLVMAIDYKRIRGD